MHLFKKGYSSRPDMWGMITGWLLDKQTLLDLSNFVLMHHSSKIFCSSLALTTIYFKFFVHLKVVDRPSWSRKGWSSASFCSTPRKVSIFNFLFRLLSVLAFLAYLLFVTSFSFTLSSFPCCKDIETSAKLLSPLFFFTLFRVGIYTYSDAFMPPLLRF